MAKISTETHLSIENVTEHVIELAPCPAGPENEAYAAVCLLPGRNFVSRAYLSTVMNRVVEDRFGAKRKPQEKMLERLGDQILVDESEAALQKREGVDPPKTLRGLSPAQALAFIDSEKDPKILTRWHDALTARDHQLKDAIELRLHRVSR